MIFSMPELPPSWAILPLPRWEETHPGTRPRQRLPGHLPRLLCPVGEDGVDFLGLGRELGAPLAHRREGGTHVVGQDLLAVKTPPPRRPALRIHVSDRRRRREMLVEGEDVADLGVPRVLLDLPRRVGESRPELLPDRFGRIEEAHGVAEALRHLGL